ncbi:MAG: DUF2085 domain-containing protein [Myxococcaceae bacterium]|nr:DUF2085 domain-containing protein [Myxococcaceae bacterium]
MFWLSHHPPEEYDRCYRVGPLHVCARCLGVYPTLVVMLVALFAVRAPLEHPLDLPVVLCLTAPATLDWAFGRFRPHALSNLWRTFTGVLLGLALGRSLFIHLQRPFPTVLLAQFALVTGIVLPVILATYRGRPRG